MATIKEPKATNNLHSTIALLDAAAFCDDLSMVVDTIKVIIKRDFKKSTTTTREINSMLNLLSNVIPLISESVKSKASKCAPTKSNASYVRSRLQSQSNPLGMSGIERLKQLLIFYILILVVEYETKRRYLSSAGVRIISMIY